jgi:hypothetical protein
MPVPSFWPEKATEWVALIGGAFGGLLGTLAFLLSVLNYRRDRSKLGFSAEQETPEPIYPPDLNPFEPITTLEAYKNIVFPDNVIFKLRVTNLGRRPIRIEEVWGILGGPRPDLQFKLQTETTESDSPGIVLTESEPTAIYKSDGYIKGFGIKDIIRFAVYDSAYREHRYYHRGYLRGRAVETYERIYFYFWRRRNRKNAERILGHRL